MILSAVTTFTIDAPSQFPCTLMMRPVSGLAQKVLADSIHIDPVVPMTAAIDLYGNRLDRLVFPAGRTTLYSECKVEVSPVIDVHPEAGFCSIDTLPTEVLPFLLPSRFCQSDLLLKQVSKIVRGVSPGYRQVEAIRAWIHRKIKYKYGVSTESTSAIDTLKLRKGVCRDFAHLGISLCRAIRIPARMVSGYLYRLDPMDLHVWFEAYVGGRWYTFDATRKTPMGGRIAVAYGRDIADVAFMSEFGPVQLTDMVVTVTEAN